MSLMEKMKTRDSNMEVLRIVAMLLVMIVHADFMALGAPTMEDMSESPMDTFMRYLIGGMSSVCVNVFVLISGWYGIRFRINRIFKLLFQTFFFVSFIFLFLVWPKDIETCLTEVKDFLFLKGYWFIAAYLLLFIMAPVLNAFCEHSSRLQLRNLIISFFIFQTVYSYFGNKQWYDDGYSPLPFFGLYLLARYLRMYPNRFSCLNKRWDLCIWIAISMGAAILSMLLLAYGTGGRFYNYTSPLMLVSSSYLFLFFTKIHVNNKFINWMGKSCFAAFLVHMNPHFINTYYVAPIQRWHTTEPGIIMIGHTTGYILLIFLIAVLLDQIQCFLSHLLKLDQ